MILSGVLISPDNQLYKQAIELAKSVLENGPPIWDKKQIDKARFYITDSVDDVLSANNYALRIAAATKLYEQLAEFYFRAQNKWQADGKGIISFLYRDNPELADTWSLSFEELFKNNSLKSLELLVLKILEPYGGLFWEGFHLNAPRTWKK